MENRLIKAVALTSLLGILFTGCTKSEVTKNSNPQNSKNEASFISENTSSDSDYRESSEAADESEGSANVSSAPEESVDPPAESDVPSDDTPYIPSDDELVLIKDYIPTIRLDIRYATTNNFTGQIIYDTADTYLRYGTVKKLMAVQEELEAMGLSLLVWDAYRPTEAQEKLWSICPDPNFVSDPKNGFSGHCRGGAIDITVVTSDGEFLEMPSGFDEFTALADRDYSDVSVVAAENSQMLEDIMEKHGFSGYRKEWWHYSDTVSYPVVGQEE